MPRKIVVVGCSRGIGKAVADHFDAHGHEVLRLARSRCDGHYMYADVTNWPRLVADVTNFSGVWDHVDCLIYCAGIQGAIGKCMDMNFSEWAEVINTNLTGFFNTTKAFYPLLRRTDGRSKVIAFAGGGAAKARPNFSAYGASKAGLVRLIDSLSEELPNFDINALAPGAHLTDMIREIVTAGPQKAGVKEYDQAINMQKDPKKMSKLMDCLEFLLSAESDGISGRLIPAQHPNLRDIDWTKSDMFRLCHVDGR